MLIPLSRSRRWMLVGDRRQLPPFREAPEKRLEPPHPDVVKTLFDRFEENLPKDCRGALLEQRRMCRSIGELIAKVFYPDMLINNVTPDSGRPVHISNVYPFPVTWISTSKLSAREEEFKKSRRNLKEVEIVVAEIEKLASANPKGQKLEIAVIAGYAAQIVRINIALANLRARRSEIEIDCNTIDAFQGREADVCFYSVTRSNNDDKLGFLTESERLNVALSRARDALVIVGDDAFCRACPPPNPFIDVLRYIDKYNKSCLRIDHA
jgi:superfamily I DNA and/or RNA helicase